MLTTKVLVWCLGEEWEEPKGSCFPGEAAAAAVGEVVWAKSRSFVAITRRGYGRVALGSTTATRRWEGRGGGGGGEGEERGRGRRGGVGGRGVGRGEGEEGGGGRGEGEGEGKKTYS